MLTLLSGSAALPLNIYDYHVRQLSTGENELEFEISIHDPVYQQIQEEAQIREESDALPPARYLVKAIDGGKETATVICKLDLDAWKGALTVPYNSGSVTISALVNSIKPAGWTVINRSGKTIRRTLALEAATPHDVLTAAREVFGVTYSFDNLTNRVTIINPDAGTMRGAFATKELNLKENNYRGKSSAFCTRLYAFGKDGLTFREINGGKPYVENFTYSGKVICGYWKDERYTVAENLLTDTRAKLALLAVPERSYDCDVMDLAKLAPDEYGFLQFQMFDIVGLIDETRAGTTIYHKVVEYWVFPYFPEKNKVVLSTSPAKIQSQLKNLTNAIEDPNSVWNLAQSAAQSAAIANATNTITGNNGGYVALSLNDAGQPYEILIMDTPDKLTARRVWRWNQGGLGYSAEGYNGRYGLAMTQDGAIVADFITVGALKSDRVTVGGFTLSDKSLRNGMTAFDDILNAGVYLGTDGIALGAGKFKVDPNGNINAVSGAFGGFVLSATGLKKGMGSLYDTANNGVYLGTDGIALGAGKFRVTADGKVRAADLEISGGRININNGAFRVETDGTLYARDGNFEGNVYAKNISYGGSAGSFDGYGLTESTVLGGWGGAIGSGTVGTLNTSLGINNSLSNGDTAFGQINDDNYGGIWIANMSFRGRSVSWLPVRAADGGIVQALCSY